MSYPAYPHPQGPPPPGMLQPYPPQPPTVIHQPGPGYYQAQSWHSNTDFSAYLRGATSFHVKQDIEVIELVTNFETENKYSVKDNHGNKLFKVREDSDCLSRQCCARFRSINLNVRDRAGREILRFYRPFNLACWCSCICNDSMVVSANGQQIGEVVEECGIFRPCYKLKDAAGNTQLRVVGPMILFSCFGGNVNFDVETKDGTVVGRISKEWSGWAREMFTDADFFSVSFPIDLDASMKAVCLACVFLIDYQYFESKGSRGKQGGRRFFG